MYDLAKKKLKKVEWLDAQIDGLLHDLQKEEARATKVTSIISPVVVTHSGNQSNLEEAALKIIALKNEINQKIDRFVDLKRDVEAIIDKIQDADQVKVLRKRYFEYKPWELIALEVGCQYRNVHYIHGNALKAFQEILEGGM